MSRGPVTIMPDGAQKRQGDSMAPQAALARVARSSDVVVNQQSTVFFDLKTYDPYSWYDTTTGRFTPKIAGAYKITTALQIATGAFATDTIMEVGIRKNGSMVAWGPTTPMQPAVRPIVFAEATVWLNGTTDYVDIVPWVNGATSLTVGGDGGGLLTWAEIALVGTSVGVQPEPWHWLGNPGEPTLNTGWTNTYSTSAQARFYKDPYGEVKVGGSVNTAGTSTTIFTLPVGYRPIDGEPRFAVAYWTGAARVLGMLHVLVTGVVNMYGNADNLVSAQYINLDVIKFRASG